jgi:hypothetical protein
MVPEIKQVFDSKWVIFKNPSSRPRRLVVLFGRVQWGLAGFQGITVVFRVDDKVLGNNARRRPRGGLSLYCLLRTRSRTELVY